MCAADFLGIRTTAPSHIGNCAVVQPHMWASERMKTVAITINKGGVGKTTLAKALATAAATAGFNALVLDMDTQQNSTAWGRRRSQQPERPLPVVRFTTENDLMDELRRAENASCDLAFIDTPPGRSSEAPAAVDAADLVLIPFWADVDSFEGVTRTATLCRRLGKPAVGILNFATPNSRTHEETSREVLRAINLSFSPVVLHRYEAHKLASLKGLTAQENEPASQAALEINALWSWVSAQLHIGTSALVQKGAA
jgi:chromosome partitioning protein